MTGTLPHTLTPLGRAPGRCVATDPSGRFLALAQGRRRVVIYDTAAALTPTSSHRLPDDTYEVAVHPDGAAIARLTHTWHLELRQEGRRARRLPTAIGASALLADAQRHRWGAHGAGWVQFTSDGAWLLVGDIEGPHAGISLYDAATLRLVERAAAITGAYPREPIGGWGEGVICACAPSPSTAVAFAASAGDDVVTLGVAEVIGGRLALHGVTDEPAALSDKIPGERIHALCLTHDDLFIADSDEILSHLRWREGHAAIRRFASGYDLADAPPPALAGLYPDDDTRLCLIGPFARVGGELLLSVERETLLDDRYHWSGWALLGFDADARALRGWCPTPARDRLDPVGMTPAGVLYQHVGAQTEIWRLTPHPATDPGMS
jgi:hypothetical protein